MLDRTTHPFIWNTLKSSPNWEVGIGLCQDSWEACLHYGQDYLAATIAEGSTLSEALNRLEALLAGREYVKPDPEREAYLARWKDAPEWAEWLSQDPDGRCDFFEAHPEQDELGNWCETGCKDCRQARDNLLGSVRCEPRPEL